MKKFKVYMGFSIAFSILMLLGIAGIVITQLIDLAVIESSMQWLVEFCNKIGIHTLEQAQRVVMVYVGVVYLFVFFFSCLTFKHGSRALNRVKNARAQSAQVYITSEEDVKKIKKQKAKKKAEDLKMKSREQRIAEKAAKKAKRQAIKAAKLAQKEVKQEVVAPIVKKVEEVQKEVVKPAVKKASNKIDSILDELK